MEDHGSNQTKGHNVFGVFVDKPLGYPSSGEDEHKHKKLKSNSEAPLSTIDQQVLSLPLPNLLVSAFKENPTDGVKFQLFVSRSYNPRTSISLQPGNFHFSVAIKNKFVTDENVNFFGGGAVYTLKVTSASNSSGEVEQKGNIVDGGATPLLTETRLVAEGQFMLRSRL